MNNGVKINYINFEGVKKVVKKGFAIATLSITLVANLGGCGKDDIVDEYSIVEEYDNVSISDYDGDGKSLLIFLRLPGMKVWVF